MSNIVVYRNTGTESNKKYNYSKFDMEGFDEFLNSAGSLNELDYYKILNKIICNHYSTLINNHPSEQITKVCIDYVNYNINLTHNKVYLEDLNELITKYLGTLKGKNQKISNMVLWDLVHKERYKLSIKQQLSYILNFAEIFKPTNINYTINYDPTVNWITDLSVEFYVEDFNNLEVKAIKVDLKSVSNTVGRSVSGLINGFNNFLK